MTMLIMETAMAWATGLIAGAAVAVLIGFAMRKSRRGPPNPPSAAAEPDGRRLWYEHVAENCDQGIWVVDSHAVLTYVNPALARMLGYERDELIGKNSFLLLAEGDVKRALKFRREGPHRGISGSIRLEFKHKQGHRIEVELRTIPHFENGAYRFGVAFVTELPQEVTPSEEATRFAAELRQSHRLETLGSLTTGICRDIKSAFQRLDEALDDSAGARSPDIATARTISARERERLARFEGFATELLPQTNSAECSWHPILRQVVRNRGGCFPAELAVEEISTATHPKVACLASELANTLGSLAQYLTSQLPEAGETLQIRVEDIEADPENGPKTSEVPRPAVRFTISAPGATPAKSRAHDVVDLLAMAQDTSHDLAALAGVEGVVRIRGGRISVDSTSPAETRVILELPTAAASPEPEPDKKPVHAPADKTTVLLVDDESALVDLQKELLEQQGFSVRTATTGKQALDTFQSSCEEIDAVVTDQSMPGTSGVDLTREIRQLRPETPVIMCTGNSERLRESRFLSEGIDLCLYKPFRPEDLKRAIVQVLTMPRPGAGT